MNESCTVGSRAQLWGHGVVCLGLALLVVSCGHECHDIIEGSQQALSTPPPADGWHMPKDVADIAATLDMAYVGAPAWNGGANCSGGMRQGSRTVSAYVQQHFAGVESVGGYNCRQIRNSSSMSVHGTGRAIDIMIPVLADGGANNAVGDPIANWLVVNAERLGIHLIIWDQASWGPHRDHYNTVLYNNPGYPHKNHLHVELSEAAASETSQWFKDGGLNESPLTSPYHAEFTQMEQTDALGTMVQGRAGEMVTVSFAFENVGSKPWLPGEVQLAVVSPARDAAAPEFMAPTWLSPSRLAALSARTEPGQVGVFEFEVTVPSQGGVRDLYVAPVRDKDGKQTWLSGVGGPYDHHGVYLLVESPGETDVSVDVEVEVDAGFEAEYGGEVTGCSVNAFEPSSPGSLAAVLLVVGLCVRRRRR